MAHHDTLPAPDASFATWINNLIHFITEDKLTRWNIPQEDYNQLTSLHNTFVPAYNKSQDPNRGKADTAAKTEARKILEKYTRQFIKEHLAYNSKVTNEDRIHLGIPVHDTTPTRTPLITEMPALEVDFSKHQRHTLHVKVDALTGATKPTHAKGFEAWRKIGGTPPETDNDWTFANSSSQAYLTLDYHPNDIGKTVYYRVRWMNTRNEPGPWNESIVTAVVA